MTGLITLIVVVVVVGLIMWVVNEHLPIPQPYRTILNVIVLLATLLWVLRHFGIW
jgi:cobalamin biosynthesis protein CobD/CbiB